MTRSNHEILARNGLLKPWLSIEAHRVGYGRSQTNGLPVQANDTQVGISRVFLRHFGKVPAAHHGVLKLR